MLVTGILPRELEDIAKKELEPGEKIVWMEQPMPRILTAQSLGLFLFAVPWTAFAVFWIFAAAGFRMPDFGRNGVLIAFPLFGIPFVLIGVGMLSSPLLMYLKTKKTVYVITDRRAIIIESWRKTTVKSFLPESLKSIVRKERSDGSGDVIINGFSYSLNGNKNSNEIGFFNVRNAKEFERMLKELSCIS